jgi:hypothetical protein
MHDGLYTQEPRSEQCTVDDVGDDDDDSDFSPTGDDNSMLLSDSVVNESHDDSAAVSATDECIIESGIVCVSCLQTNCSLGSIVRM